MNRRRFISQTGILGAGTLLAPNTLKAAPYDFPIVRTQNRKENFLLMQSKMRF